MPPGRPDIRRLGTAEIPQIHALWNEAGLVFRPEGRDAPAVFARELEEARTFLLGFYEEDRLVGVALGTDDGRKGWINRVAVATDRRRSGIGRALIRACEAVLVERGIGIISCLIEGANEASFNLFEAAGYEIRRDITYLRKPITNEDW